jgi:hypothetical protein
MTSLVILSDSGRSLEVHELTPDQRLDVQALAEYMLGQLAELDSPDDSIDDPMDRYSEPTAE